MGPNPEGDSERDWRRFRRALVFFFICLGISVSLFAIGLYH